MHTCARDNSIIRGLAVVDKNQDADALVALVALVNCRVTKLPIHDVQSHAPVQFDVSRPLQRTCAINLLEELWP